MSAAYVPETGDFIWLTFDPQAGREQAGRRPALVLSPRTYNAKSGLALVCPITNQAKGYPFRGGCSLNTRRDRCNPGRSREERRLESPPRGKGWTLFSRGGR